MSIQDPGITILAFHFSLSALSILSTHSVALLVRIGRLFASIFHIGVKFTQSPVEKVAWTTRVE